MGERQGAQARDAGRVRVEGPQISLLPFQSPSPEPSSPRAPSSNRENSGAGTGPGTGIADRRNRGPQRLKVSGWLHAQGNAPLPSPGTLADEFPLATIPSPPLSSSVESFGGDYFDHKERRSYRETERDRLLVKDGGGRDRSIGAARVHPPTPTLPKVPTVSKVPTAPMDEHPHLSQSAQARRRSSSLASTHLPNPAHRKNKHRRVRSEHHIPEERDSSDERDGSSEDKSDSTDVELDDMGSDDGLEDDEETGLTGRDKRKRRRRKKRNTRLDNRFVPPPDDPYKSEEERVADRSVLREGMINAALIALW